METNNESCFEVDFGTVVPRYPIDRYKVSMDKKDQITILSQKPLVTKTVWIKDLGEVFFSPEFTELGLKPRIKYNFLIAVWESDRLANLAAVPKFQVQFMSLNEDTYLDLADKKDLYGDLSNVLLKLTCKEEKYQSFTLDYGGVAPHATDPELKTKLLSVLDLKKALLKDCIASSVGIDRVKEVLSSQSSHVTNEEKTEFESRMKYEKPARTRPVAVDTPKEDFDPSTFDMATDVDEFLGDFDEK